MMVFSKASVQRSDAVDDQGEGRSTSQLGLMEVAIPNSFLIGGVGVCEVTVQVNGRTVDSTIYNHGCAYYRLTGRILDCTFYLLSERIGAAQTHYREDKGDTIS